MRRNPVYYIALLLLACIYQLWAPPPCTAICTDDALGAAKDTGCNDPNAPICVDGGPSDATGSGSACAVCIDDAAGSGVDTGCAGVLDPSIMRTGLPARVCFTLSASAGAFAGGTACAVCVDDQTEDRRDSGCSEASHPFCADVLGDDATDGWRNDGNFYQGFCVECLDSNGGYNPSTPDTGCNLEEPFCFSLYNVYYGNGGLTHNPQFSGWCTRCLDTQRGPTIIGQDAGCPPEAPLCGIQEAYFPESTYYYDLVSDCYKCIDSNGLLNPDTGTGCAQAGYPFCVPAEGSFTTQQDLGSQCAACFDDEGGLAVDVGCSESSPLCADEGASDGDRAPGMFCAECVDDKLQLVDGNFTLLVDSGCSANARFCLDGRVQDASGGYGACAPAANPSCILNVTGSSGNREPATCLQDLAVEGQAEISIADCRVYDADLGAFVDALVDDFFTGRIPRCAVEMAADSTGNSTGGATRRHLLQSPAQIALAFRLYVDDVPSGGALLAALASPGFRSFLSAYFDVTIGTVLDVQNIRAAFVRLASAQSDPHFTTARGDKFDFNGEAGRSYCIVSDRQLQVNARFMGAAGGDKLGGGTSAAVPQDTRTWMDQVAIMAGSDRVLVDATMSESEAFATSFGNVLVNGERLLGVETIHTLPSGITVSRKRTRVSISIPEVAVVKVEVVRAGFWESSSGPGKHFLNLQMAQFKPTGDVHGVLGQSFASDGEEALVGTALDYVTSNILATDCRFNRFGSQ